MYASQRLGQWIADVSASDVPPDVLRKARDCVIDSVGCAIGGALTDLGPMYIAVARAIGGHPEATILGTTERAAAVVAASSNAELANKLDFDDFAGEGHVAPTVVHPALAVGEQLGLHGAAILPAIAVGYEISNRVSASLQRGPLAERLMFGLGTWQSIGTAATVGHLLGLDATQLAHALAITACTAPVPSAIKTCRIAPDTGAGSDLRPTSVKNNFGMAVWAGMTGAMLAREGLTGPLDVFEGHGFWRWTGAVESSDAELRAPDGDWSIRQICFKDHPTILLWLAPVRVARQLVRDSALTLDEIESIEVSPGFAVREEVFRRTDVDELQEALLSLPWAVASGLSDIPKNASYFPTGRDDPRVRTLAEKVTMVDPVAVPHGSSSRRAQHVAVSIRSVDGRQHSLTAVVEHGETYAFNPDPREKFVTLCEPLLGARTGAAFSALSDLNERPVREVMGLLSPTQ